MQQQSMAIAAQRRRRPPAFVRWCRGLGLAGTLVLVGVAGCGSAPHPPIPNRSTPVATAGAAPSPRPAAPITALQASRTAMQAIVFRSRRLGFLAGPGAIWESTDGGRSWRQVYQGRARLGHIVWVSPDTGLAWGAHAILASTDGGSWHRVFTAPGYLLALSWVSARQGWAVWQAGSAAAALHVTRDGGSRWQSVPVPFRPIAVGFSDSLRGWAVSHHHVWQTTDGGRHWTAVASWSRPVPAAATVAPVGSVAWVELIGGSGMSQTSYTLLRLTNGKVTVVAARSTAGAGPAPGGAPLTAPAAPGVAPGPLAVISSETAVLGGLCEACGGGTVALWETTNGGAAWTVHPPIYGVNGTADSAAVSFLNGHDGWLVTGGGTRTAVLATTDGGRSWTQRFPSPQPVENASFPAAHLGYAVGLPGEPDRLVATRDGGRHWHPVGTLPGRPPIWNGVFGTPVLAFADARRGWVASGGRLWHTRNGGASWSPVALPGWSPTNPVDRLVRLGTIMVAGSLTGTRAWWSTDDGQRWNLARHTSFGVTLVDAGSPVHRALGVMPNAQGASAGGSARGVWWLQFDNLHWAISLNHGRRWQLQTPPPSLQNQGGAAAVAYSGPDRAWLITLTGLWWTTVNAGRSWQLLP